MKEASSSGACMGGAVLPAVSRRLQPVAARGTRRGRFWRPCSSQTYRCRRTCHSTFHLQQRGEAFLVPVARSIPNTRVSADITCSDICSSSLQPPWQHDFKHTQRSIDIVSLQLTARSVRSCCAAAARCPSWPFARLVPSTGTIITTAASS
jgi:hypothetical protein